MASFYKAPTSNFWSTTLNGAINDSVDTITLSSTTGLQSPGVLIIDREDGNGTATPSAREIISYTGISSNDLTGVTRAFDNSTARSHSTGALVEAVPTVGMWNDVSSALKAMTADDATGASLLVSTATVTGILDTTVTKQSLATLESSGTVNIDLDTGNAFKVTMPDSEMTLTMSNETPGQVVLLDIIQRAQASAPTVTWPATTTWTQGVEPTLTSGSGQIDTLGFRVIDTDTYYGYIVGQNI